MQKKQKINLLILGGIVIVLLLVIFLWPHAETGLPVQNGNPSVSNSKQSVSQSETVTSVPANVTVPNIGDKNIPQDVAVPQIQSAAAPQSSASYRSFAISVNNNQFTPSTVIAKVGDTVDLEITAVDKNYDFTQPDLGLTQTIAQGATKKVQFAPMASGKFTFYCASCGGPDKGPIGYIIVTN